ncbi:MAG: alpha/beta hydrolase-fold protein [Actinomycetota bacterium]|nr:alpha/beta hydrolase-fold protein [Actinomycetota bacterium]
MRPADSLVEVLDPDLTDSRLQTVGRDPVAWAAGGLLTIAVRGGDRPPWLVGTVEQRMRPAGAGCWALRLRVPKLDRASIEYGLVDEDDRGWRPGGVWRGARAGREAARARVRLPEFEMLDAPEREIADRHRGRCWSPPDPQALVLCADGESIATWASVVAGADMPVALVGISSAGRQVGRLEDDFDPTADPRARAYLPDVDPPYFAAHMRYVLKTVLPWARARVGNVPALVFGASNGAAFAAAAAAMHPGAFAAALVFSLGVPPPFPAADRDLPHALVAGQLEPGFYGNTTRYARQLRARGVPVRLIRPMRGHDHTMWCDEFVPALRWALEYRRPNHTT